MNSTINPRITSCAENGGTDVVPADFDPRIHPIIARHWFGIEPARPIGKIARSTVSKDLDGDRIPAALICEV